LNGKETAFLPNSQICNFGKSVEVHCDKSVLKITFAKLIKKPDMDDGPAYLAQILTHV